MFRKNTKIENEDSEIKEHEKSLDTCHWCSLTLRNDAMQIEVELNDVTCFRIRRKSTIMQEAIEKSEIIE